MNIQSSVRFSGKVTVDVGEPEQNKGKAKTQRDFEGCIDKKARPYFEPLAGVDALFKLRYDHTETQPFDFLNTTAEVTLPDGKVLSFHQQDNLLHLFEGFGHFIKRVKHKTADALAKMNRQDG